MSDLSNLTVFGLFVSAAGIYKRFNCSEKRCRRIGHLKVEGTTFRTCHHHTTQEVHERLYKMHSEKYPEQHEWLNRPPTETPPASQS